MPNMTQTANESGSEGGARSGGRLLLSVHSSCNESTCVRKWRSIPSSKCTPFYRRLNPIWAGHHTPHSHYVLSLTITSVNWLELERACDLRGVCAVPKPFVELLGRELIRTARARSVCLCEFHPHTASPEPFSLPCHQFSV